MTYQKLVRDKVPDRIAKKGESPRTRILGEREYKKELRKKLLEEAQECSNAKKKISLIEELADLYEVCLSLSSAEGISFTDVRRRAKEKVKTHGGFAKKLFLIDVTS